jgi:hypothetical protein
MMHAPFAGTESLVPSTDSPRLSETLVHVLVSNHLQLSTYLPNHVNIAEAPMRPRLKEY